MGLTDKTAEVYFAGPISPKSGQSFYDATQAHAKVGFQRLGDQDPYFYTRVGIDRRLNNCSWESTCMHLAGTWNLVSDPEIFTKEFDHLKILVKYNLWGMKTGPMNYISNALYHARQVEIAYHIGDRFESTCVHTQLKKAIGYGLLLGDDTVPLDVIAAWAPSYLTKWLGERLPHLLNQFKSDVQRLLPGLWEQAEKL